MRQYAAEALKGLYTGDPAPSAFAGGRTEALRRLEAFDVGTYNQKQSIEEDTCTSLLSPYIRHGLLSLREVRDSVLDRFGPQESRGFVLQLLWRAFWYLLYRERSMAQSVDGALSTEAEEGRESGGVRDAESGRVGEWESGRRRGPATAPPHSHTPTPPHSPTLPLSHTPDYGPYCVDESLRCLRETGFLSYQARLWVASYLLHFQGIDWREGFRHFQEHLADADAIVNALSWRWVLGEISGRPYFYNQERVKQRTAGEYCARCTVYKCPFEGSVEAVEERARRPGGIIR